MSFQFTKREFIVAQVFSLCFTNNNLKNQNNICYFRSWFYFCCMVESTIRIQSLLNFLLNQMFMFYCRSQIFDCDTFLNCLLSSCHDFDLHSVDDAATYIFFSTFISRPITFLTSIKVSVLKLLCLVSAFRWWFTTHWWSIKVICSASNYPTNVK
jgi:hypothetical protein